MAHRAARFNALMCGARSVVRSGHGFKQNFGLLIRAAVPFILMMMVCLALVVWQPWIAMYLVNGKF